MIQSADSLISAFMTYGDNKKTAVSFDLALYCYSSTNKERMALSSQ